MCALYTATLLRMPHKRRPRIQGPCSKCWNPILSHSHSLTPQVKSQSRETISAIAASDAGSIVGNSSGIHRGAITSRHDFGAVKYLKKHKRLLIKPKGNYFTFWMRMKLTYRESCPSSSPSHINSSSMSTHRCINQVPSHTDRPLLEKSLKLQ